MDKPTVLAFLKALRAKQVTVHGDWISASCPLAPWEHQSGKDAHPSFAIKIVPAGESVYNCFTCGGGDLISLVQRMQHHGADAPRYDLTAAVALAVEDGDRPLAFNVKDWGEAVDEPYVTFPEAWLETFMPATRSKRAMRYLRRRGLPESVITFLDLRYDTDKDAVAFPVRDFEGVLCGLRARRLDPSDDQPRYHVYKTYDGGYNRLVWFGEAWLDFDKAIVMCESVFDVASVLRVYPNVCAPMTAGFSETRARRMRQAIEIVTLFDADRAGDKGRGRVERYLPSARIIHAKLPEGRKDPGEMTAAELRELLGGFVKLKKERETA